MPSTAHDGTPRVALQPFPPFYGGCPQPFISTPFPLWDECNKTLYSSPFTVMPGKAVLLQAVGLEQFKVKQSDTEFTAPQAICVERLQFAPFVKLDRNSVCEWVVSEAGAEFLSCVTVQRCGKPWMLTCDNNVGVIGIPGYYRLALNDATAIQVAQVFAEQYDIGFFSPSLFF